MLTNSVLHYFGVFINIGARMKISPFWWNHSSKRIFVEKNRKQWICWRLCGIHCFGYFVYVSYRLIVELTSKNINYSVLSMLFIFEMSYLWSSIIYYSFYTKKEEMVSLMTQLIE